MISLKGITALIRTTVKAKEKLVGIARAIQKEELKLTNPRGAHILWSIHKEITPERSYQLLKKQGLGMRKQNFLAYYKYLKQTIMKWRLFAILDDVKFHHKKYKAMSNRDIVRMKEDEEYNFKALMKLRDFMKDEFEDYINENYEGRAWKCILAESSEFELPEAVTARTYEFEVFTAWKGEDVEEEGQRQFYLIYNEGEIIDSIMWWSFRENIFRGLIKRIGLWER